MDTGLLFERLTFIDQLDFFLQKVRQWHCSRYLEEEHLGVPLLVLPTSYSSQNPCLARVLYFFV